MTVETAFGIVGMVTGLVGAVTGIVALFVTWWAPRASEIRKVVADAEPDIYFAVGCYGGPAGNGIGLNLQNRGTAPGQNIALHLPGPDAPGCDIPELPPGETPYIQMPVRDDHPLRTQPREGLTAQLVYHDRFGRRFEMSRHLVYQRRDDGFYNVGTDNDAPPAMSRPRLSALAVWRLRHVVP